ncbi:hypothetical protein F7725_020391 [Dissostichus mawsoni]|uniref:Uncharacterized protein n=1 Tax=Dissostichus mawsoni TaxID=36200 RepID=A0A7J5YE32_DISMA|nr:hypothetical protein F7725_020391 [Dissostichus mawsoni]
MACLGPPAGMFFPDKGLSVSYIPPAERRSVHSTGSTGGGHRQQLGGHGGTPPRMSSQDRTWTDVVTRVQTVKVESCPGTWLILLPALSGLHYTGTLKYDLMMDICGDEVQTVKVESCPGTWLILLPALSGLHYTGTLEGYVVTRVQTVKVESCPGTWLILLPALSGLHYTGTLKYDLMMDIHTCTLITMVSCQWTDVVTRVQTVKVESCPGIWLILLPALSGLHYTGTLQYDLMMDM